MLIRWCVYIEQKDFRNVFIESFFIEIFFRILERGIFDFQKKDFEGVKCRKLLYGGGGFLIFYGYWFFSLYCILIEL